VMTEPSVNPADKKSSEKDGGRKTEPQKKQ